MVLLASTNTIKQRTKEVLKSRRKKSDKVKANTNVFGVMHKQKMPSIVVMDKSINTVSSVKVVIPIQNSARRKYISDKRLRIKFIKSKERHNKNCSTVYNPDDPNRVSKNQVQRVYQTTDKPDNSFLS